MKKYLPVLFVFVVVIFAIRFFEPRFINKSFVNYSNLIVCSLAIAVSIPFFFIRRKGFIFPIQLITVSIVFSFFMAYISWEQTISESLFVTAPFMLWIFFFFLLKVRLPIKTIENIVVIYGMAYVILYFFQLFYGPKVLFGTPLSGGDTFSEDRGILRIIFPGGGIFVLSIFIALNKITTEAKTKWFWLLLVILGIVIPILQATRLFISGVLLIYLIHFIRNLNIFKKVLIIGSITGILFLIGNSDLKIVNGLKEETTNDAKEGRNYVRVKASEYFLNDFSPDEINRIFGNGVPYTNFTYYGKTIERLEMQNGFYLEDVGIIAFYAMFGIVAITGFIFIWYKSFALNVPKEYYYAKYYLWFLLFTCLTTFYVYHYHYLIATVFALYIYQHAYEEQVVSQVILKDLAESSIDLEEEVI